MKINETKRNHINEGPLDLLTKSGRAQRKSFKQGQKTVKLTSENLMNEFAEYLGVQGKKNMRQATTQDVVSFLDSKNVETSDIDVNEPMTPKRLKNIFTVKSREAAQGKGAKKPAASPKAKPSQSTKSAPKSSSYAQTKGNAMKLSAKEKRRLIQQLEKSLPAAKKNTVVDKNFDKSQRLSDFGKVGN